ncbi:MAG: hypothetical protein ACRDJC_23545 [Thermomicrobiales bacterium]
MDYSKTCFVVMPDGRKVVGKRQCWVPFLKVPRWVNFDWIYENIFEPAVAETSLPEGGKLVPRRSDKDFFAAVIDMDMYLYLEYSRFTLVDITGLNPNVFYELGIRHRVTSLGVCKLAGSP